MRKRTPRENLKKLSDLYIGLAVLNICAIILFNAIPRIKTILSDITYIDLALSLILHLLHFWLAKRVVDGKSNGTLFMIILIIEIILILAAILFDEGTRTSSVGILLASYGLYCVYELRKENQKCCEQDQN